MWVSLPERRQQTLSFIYPVVLLGSVTRRGNTQSEKRVELLEVNLISGFWEGGDDAEHFFRTDSPPPFTAQLAVGSSACHPPPLPGAALE